MISYLVGNSCKALVLLHIKDIILFYRKYFYIFFFNRIVEDFINETKQSKQITKP